MYITCFLNANLYFPPIAKHWPVNNIELYINKLFKTCLIQEKILHQDIFAENVQRSIYNNIIYTSDYLSVLIIDILALIKNIIFS